MSNTSSEHRMQCMEVWGSNEAVDSGVAMAGLDAWVYSRPWHDENFGGDVHYVSSCATGRITRLLLADVSGHGETVAEAARVLRTLMRRYVNHVEQRVFMGSMNRAFGQLDDQRFATSVIASYFAPRRQLIVSNAGHPPPLLYRNKTDSWSFVTHDDAEPPAAGRLANMPLGVIDLTEYDEQRLTLDVGDMVLLYTDALTEAVGRDGAQLGLDGLLRLVRSIDVANTGGIVHGLRQRIVELNEANLDGDDLTIMLFRPNGIGGGSNFFSRAWAGMRIIGMAIARPFGSRSPVPWPEMTLENFLGVRTANVLRRLRANRRQPDA